MSFTPSSSAAAAASSSGPAVYPPLQSWSRARATANNSNTPHTPIGNGTYGNATPLFVSPSHGPIVSGGGGGVGVFPSSHAGVHPVAASSAVSRGLSLSELLDAMRRAMRRDQTQTTVEYVQHLTRHLIDVRNGITRELNLLPVSQQHSITSNQPPSSSDSRRSRMKQVINDATRTGDINIIIQHLHDACHRSLESILHLLKPVSSQGMIPIRTTSLTPAPNTTSNVHHSQQSQTGQHLTQLSVDLKLIHEIILLLTTFFKFGDDADGEGCAFEAPSNDNLQSILRSSAELWNGMTIIRESTIEITTNIHAQLGEAWKRLPDVAIDSFHLFYQLQLHQVPNQIYQKGKAEDTWRTFVMTVLKVLVSYLRGCITPPSAPVNSSPSLSTPALSVRSRLSVLLDVLRMFHAITTHSRGTGGSVGVFEELCRLIETIAPTTDASHRVEMLTCILDTNLHSLMRCKSGSSACESLLSLNFDVVEPLVMSILFETHPNIELFVLGTRILLRWLQLLEDEEDRCNMAEHIVAYGVLHRLCMQGVRIAAMIERDKTSHSRDRSTTTAPISFESFERIVECIAETMTHSEKEEQRIGIQTKSEEWKQLLVNHAQMKSCQDRYDIVKTFEIDCIEKRMAKASS